MKVHLDKTAGFTLRRGESTSVYFGHVSNGEACEVRRDKTEIMLTRQPRPGDRWHLHCNGCGANTTAVAQAAPAATPKAPPKALAPPVKKKAPKKKPAPDVPGMNARDAIAVIREQLDPDQLVAWAEAETEGKERTTVLDAIDEQLAELEEE